MNSFTRGNCLITAGVVVTLVCVVLMSSFGLIFKSILNNLLVIDPDNAIFDTFTASSVPIYLAFYFFNVTNPDEVQYEGAKPRLIEMGPYIYREISEKYDYVFHDNEGTVEYRESTVYVFEREMSVGPETDNVTSLNPIMVIMGSLVYSQSNINFVWDDIEDAMDLFETHNVGEWLLYGYQLPSFNIRFPPFQRYNGTAYDISCQLGHCVPQLEPNLFGYYYGTNGSNDGLYRVYTGAKGMENYQYVKEWNNDERLHYWGEQGHGRDPYCNMINGTVGTQFPPWIDRDQILPVFSTDLCRSIDFRNEGDVSVQDKIDCYHFVLPPDVLQSGNTNPDNKCYCIPLPDDPDGNGCLDDCMLNTAPCQGGLPIVISMPHFYQGNETDVESFIGLSPQQRLHETYLDVEPQSGFVMQAHKRIQLNLPLKRYGTLSTFKNVTEVIFPVLWADENAIIPEDDAKTAHFLLESIFVVAYVLLAFILLIGLILIGVGVMKRRKSSEDKD